MSFHRENIIWPSKNGTWNRGFFSFTYTGADDEFDPEWDVEYDHNRFNWVRTGLSSFQAALDAWDGANPGSHSMIEKYDAAAEQCDRLDQGFKSYRSVELTRAFNNHSRRY